MGLAAVGRPAERTSAVLRARQRQEAADRFGHDCIVRGWDRWERPLRLELGCAGHLPKQRRSGLGTLRWQRLELAARFPRRVVMGAGGGPKGSRTAGGLCAC
jgi:hypothetical protein